MNKLVHVDSDVLIRISSTKVLTDELNCITAFLSVTNFFSNSHLVRILFNIEGSISKGKLWPSKFGEGRLI